MRDGSDQSPPLEQDSTREEALKVNAIATLAQETRQPLEVVREIFDEEYAPVHCISSRSAVVNSAPETDPSSLISR